MKYRIESGICAILCMLASVCFGQVKMTVDDSVAIALAHNRSIQLAEQTVKSAAGRVKEANGAGNPKLNLFGQAMERSDEIDLPLAVGINNGNLVIQNFPYKPDAAASYGLAVSQALDISGMIHTGTRVAKIGAQSVELNVSGVRNNVALQTKLAYYDVLRSEELLAVVQEAMRNAETRKHTAQALVDTGIASKVDAIRADASISSAQQSIISAQNAVQVTKSIVNRIIGADVNSPFDTVKPEQKIMMLDSYESYLNEALANRPEAAITSKNVIAAKLRYKLAGSGMSPQVALSAKAQIDTAHKVPQDENATIGLSVVFPLYDGDETKGRKEQAMADIESARIVEEDMRSAIMLQVKTAFVRVQNAAEKLSTANKELDHATESLRLSRLRYEEGMASQVELSDAELAFTQAQTNVVNSRYEQLGSQAELECALGRHAK